jgi:hypothetical protein
MNKLFYNPLSWFKTGHLSWLPHSWARIIGVNGEVSNLNKMPPLQRERLESMWTSLSVRKFTNGSSNTPIPVFTDSASVCRVPSMCQVWYEHGAHKGLGDTVVCVNPFSLRGPAKTLCSQQVCTGGSLQANCFTTSSLCISPEETRPFTMSCLYQPSWFWGFPSAKPQSSSTLHISTTEVTLEFLPELYMRSGKPQRRSWSLLSNRSLESQSLSNIWFSQKLAFASCKHKSILYPKATHAFRVFTWSISFKTCICIHLSKTSHKESIF